VNQQESGWNQEKQSNGTVTRLFRHSAYSSHPEDGGSSFVWNFNNNPPDYTMSHQ
jgi:hypothetical protein